MVYFFFFQAEDGIRDRNVTGVQTCALPILARYIENQARHHRAMMPGLIFYIASHALHTGLAYRERAVSGLPKEHGILGPKIGRASCREGVWVSVVGGSG